MKTLLLVTLLVFSVASRCLADAGNMILADPRPQFVRKVYASGAKVEVTNIPYVLIAWANPPAGKEQRGYQIWGDDRIIDKATFVGAIRILAGASSADIYIVGNDWAAGSELNEIVQNITKKHGVDAYFGSPYLFTKVDFRPEPEDRKKIIKTAIDETIEEQNKAEMAAPRKPAD